MLVKNTGAVYVPLGWDGLNPGEVKEIDDALCFTERAQNLRTELGGPLEIPHSDEPKTVKPEKLPADDLSPPKQEKINILFSADEAEQPNKPKKAVEEGKAKKRKQ